MPINVIKDNPWKQKTTPMRTTINLLCALVFLGAGACRKDPGVNRAQDYLHLPAFTERGLQVVVEIPAGTNHKIEYDEAKKAFAVDQRDGRDRIIDFLPYPGNYGFIPSTFMDPARGGDGGALDVLLISEAVPTGTVLEARPIAALLLMDEGRLDTKIIAVPADSSRQVMKAQNFQEFSITYDGAKHIIENWFLYYDGLGATAFKGWRDEQFALEAVRKWMVVQAPE